MLKLSRWFSLALKSSLYTTISSNLMMPRSAAFVWDFDGVIVLTPHEDAWRLACEHWGIRGFSHEFYSRYVSGRPRLEGARNILENLAPHLLAERGGSVVEEFAEYKTRVYLRLVEEGRYSVNWGVVSFICKARAGGITQVLASASRNVLVLAERVRVGGLKLAELFDADVSGKGSSKREVFRRALQEVFSRVRSAECIVFFDDSPAGVEAAKEAGGKAVGCFDEGLASYGADLVVKDFSLWEPAELLEAVGCRA
uniref:HAD family phosphatase n=1 Tax=Thermofilum pendens TaxID=2269 RepID=A0A7J3X6V4_THEPE